MRLPICAHSLTLIVSLAGDQEDDMDVFSLDGDCDEVVQNCARDQNVIEALLTALVAPVTTGRVQQHEDNSRGEWAIV